MYVFRYRPNNNIFKTLGSYTKNYVREVKNSIKSSKNGHQIVKNESFQKNKKFRSFYVIMSIHARNCVCRSNGVTSGQYTDKVEKTMKKVKKCPKYVNNNNLGK